MSAESRKQDSGRQIRRARALCHINYLQFQSSTRELENRYADLPSTAQSTDWDDSAIYARSSRNCDSRRCSAWEAKLAGSAFLSASRPSYTTDAKGWDQFCCLSMCFHSGKTWRREPVQSIRQAKHSDTGNRTPGYRVRGDNVSHYTISD
jgi:hypothetical protein